MGKESLRLATSEAVGNFLLKTVKTEVHGQENLEIAKDHLRRGSIILYTNHFAKLDAIIYGQVVRDHLTSLDQAATLMSQRHLDTKRGSFNSIQARLIQDWEKIFGVTTIPIVQTKDKTYYPDADNLNKKALLRALRFLRKEGRVLVVTPEGTRSKTKQLLPAEKGFETLLRFGGDNILALPVAVDYHTVLPYTKTKVLVGEPFSNNEIFEESRAKNIGVTELAMRRLASLMPERNQGHYKLSYAR